MKRKLLYLINPVSGTGDKQKLAGLITAAMEKSNQPFHILPTDPGGNYSQIEDYINKEGFTDIGICGGDGTVNAVVPKLNHLAVRFGIIPAGSGNGLALAAGIPVKTTKALDKFLEGKSRKIDAFSVNGAFACMLSGLGFDAEVAHQFAVGNNRGLGRYAWLTAKTFFQTAPYAFRIKGKNIDLSTEAYFICVANSNQFGNHVTIAPRADLSDGLLDVVIIRKQYKPLLLFRLVRHLISGKVNNTGNAPADPVIYFQTSGLEIENPQDAPLHIDGEARPSSKQMDYKIMPGYFELIC